MRCIITAYEEIWLAAANLPCTVLYGGKHWQQENLVNLQHNHIGKRKFGKFVQFPEQKYLGRYIP